MPLVATVSSTTRPGPPWRAASRLALGVVGTVIVTISLLGGAAHAAVAPVATQQITAITHDDANRTAHEVTGAEAGGDDRSPAEPTVAIGALEHEDTEQPGGKGRLKFVVGGVLVAIVIVAVVVVVLRRRGGDEY